MRLCDYHKKDHQPFAGTPVRVTLGHALGNRQRVVDGEITRATSTMVYVRYTPHPSSRSIEDRFWKKGGRRVGDKSDGFRGPTVSLIQPEDDL